MYSWSVKFSAEKARMYCKTNKETAVSFFRLFRRISILHMANVGNVKIGGEVTTVEIDETHNLHAKI